ncbi:hypothetical protein FLL45_02645 [Aliikangiella marina]|uniref:Metallo-beta-lactamase domain-containing protein n=2 Tax=Aliikangiella marina TaxID=1712262 RepID=A0A545TK26_9GAMM|nr:hypothetical protein FLL45_02645 [Aliikangiella marina]
MTISSLDAVTIEKDRFFLPTSQLNADGKFTNAKPVAELSWSRILGFMNRALFEKKVNTVPSKTIPIEKLSQHQVNQLPEDKTSVIRLGHSTILIKINNQLWLLDPVFSERASPFRFMGPKRFHPTPIEISELPSITGVILSHNHYDHMDEFSIKKLKEKVSKFVVPVGNGAQLNSWGVNQDKIFELDWWQSVNVNGVQIVATPSQHFSGRGLGDRDKALWSSWVIRDENTNLFFSGDTGYFDGFKTIGEKYGPFDLTMMETGAYDEQWPDVHMAPEETIQAHKDLRGRKMLPIHNGTFDLAFHEWTDPFEQMVDLSNREWIDLMTPKMGQVITLEDDDSVDKARDLHWWR